MPIGFILWSLASLVLIFRGICARKSEGPVRFLLFTGHHGYMILKNTIMPYRFCQLLVE